MPFDLTAGIVRILLGPNKGTAGTGFVVNNEGLVVTCAHVVEDAHAGPGDTVSLIFYAAKDKGEQLATVLPEYWRASNAEDIAFLRLEGEVPETVQPLPLTCCSGKHHFSTFGFPAQAPRDGRQGAGLVHGLPYEMEGFARLQLWSQETTKGFSGAPVWDDELQAVIGMVIGIGKGRSIKWDKQELYIPSDPFGRFPYLAFATPTETLYNSCDILKPSDICPYRGLDAFTADDVNIFFGREEAIKNLVRKLKGHPDSLAVFGPSGSGKSSLVQAGLIPHLRERLILSEHFGVITTRPSTDPFKQLAEKGLVVEPDKPNSLATGIREWLKQNEKKRLVLVIDQFEELFVTCSKPLQKDFVMQLAGMRDADLLTTVIIVMRNDFYSQFVELESLEEWMQESGGPTNIPIKLKREDLIAIIQNPAEQHRLHFQENLSELIIRDVMKESVLPSDEEEQVAQSTVLPLLEFTLTELWEHRENGMLTNKAYKDIDGVAGSITRWADKVISRFEKAKLPLVKSIFLALIHLGDEDRGYPDSRKPTSRISLMSLCQNESERESVQDIIDNLTAARLLVADRQGDEETIEIIHDALLRHWGQLKQWIADNRPFLAWHQSFEERVLEWEQRKRPKHLLYSSVQLKEAQRWTERKRLSEQEVAFLRASTTQRNLSLMGLILAVLLLISSAGVAGWFALTRPPDPTLVTTLQDNINGSLRYCFNNAPPGSKITFAQGLHGTIKLIGSLELVSGKQLTILGPGADLISISSGSIDSNIHVSEGATLNISGLSFKDSQTRSFAFLYNEGTLTVTNSVISDNKTTSGTTSYGGGIENYTTGTLTVKDSIISNNLASADLDRGLGGGIDNENKLTVIHSTFLNNRASSSSGSAWGGGIRNREKGTLTVTDSTFSGNSAKSDKQNGLGGGILNEGKLTVIHSTFSNNSASGKQEVDGGGISNDLDGTAMVIDSTFSGNTAVSSNGDSFGGGIANNKTGTLTVTDSTFSGNSAKSDKQNGLGSGGGIDSPGKLTVTDSTFSGNTASGKQEGDGGGITNALNGTAMVIDSTFSGNTASSSNGSSFGGGILNAGILSLTDSTFSGNSAKSGKQNGLGGGILNEGKLTVIHSTFLKNSVSSSSDNGGGGISNNQNGTAMVTGSTFSGNTASSSNGSSSGGGIFNISTGSFTVTSSTFSGNSASGKQNGQGGGIYNEDKLTVTSSTFLGNSASGKQGGLGGGIVNYQTGTVLVSNSTISGNTASGKQEGDGGGIDNFGKLTVVTSTIFNNTASGSIGEGGGIASLGLKGSPTIIRFSTIYGNTSNGGGGIWVDPGGSPITISSSIVAANSAHDGPDIAGALISDGYNLIENVAGATGLNARTDRQVTLTDLKIDSILHNNGGHTPTLALRQGSPAIDAVPRQLCSITVTDAISGRNVKITTDQRGDPRPGRSKNACDSGAYESLY